MPEAAASDPPVVSKKSLMSLADIFPAPRVMSSAIALPMPVVGVRLGQQKPPVTYICIATTGAAALRQSRMVVPLARTRSLHRQLGGGGDLGDTGRLRNVVGGR